MKSFFPTSLRPFQNTYLVCFSKLDFLPQKCGGQYECWPMPPPLLPGHTGVSTSQPLRVTQGPMTNPGQMRADDMWNWQAETVKCPCAILHSVPWPANGACQPEPLSLSDSVEQLSFTTPPPAHLHGNVVWIQGDLKADTIDILGLICSCSITYPILTNNNQKKKGHIFRTFNIHGHKIAFQKHDTKLYPTSSMWDCPAPSLTLVLLWGWG